MSVISVKERRQSGASRDDDAVGIDQDYVVVTDDSNEDVSNVLLHPDIPQYGDWLDGNPLIVVQNIQGNRNEANPKVWEVSISYGMPSDDPAEWGGNQKLDPELESPTIRVWHEQIERVWDTGFVKDGNDFKVAWVANSSGSLFPDPPTQEKFINVISISRKEAAALDILAHIGTYALSRADDDVIGKSNAKMRGIDATKVYRLVPVADGLTQYQVFWDVTYTIEYVRVPEFLDQGDSYIDGAGVRQHFVENGRQRIGLLDGTGSYLNGGAGQSAKGVFDFDNVNDDEPVFLEYYESEPIDWTPLNFPNSINDFKAVIFLGAQR